MTPEIQFAIIVAVRLTVAGVGAFFVAVPPWIYRALTQEGRFEDRDECVPGLFGFLVAGLALLAVASAIQP